MEFCEVRGSKLALVADEGIPSAASLGPSDRRRALLTQRRGMGILRSSLSAYRASTGPGYPSGCPGPSVANVLRRGGRPAEARHVPDNKGVGCRGGDNLALDALPAVPPLYEANRGSAARGGVDVARGALPTAVLLRPQAGLAGAPAFILVAGRGSCARKRRGVPADVAGAPYIRTQGQRPLYCRWPRCTDSSSLNAAFAFLTPLLALPLALRP